MLSRRANLLLVTLAVAGGAAFAPNVASTTSLSAPRIAAAGVRALAADSSSSRSEARKRQKAVRDLKYALVSLKIPGNAATLYAEQLASRGIGSAQQLTTLSKADLNACKMATAHRSSSS